MSKAKKDSSPFLYSHSMHLSIVICYFYDNYVPHFMFTIHSHIASFLGTIGYIQNIQNTIRITVFRLFTFFSTLVFYCIEFCVFFSFSHLFLTYAITFNGNLTIFPLYCCIVYCSNLYNNIYWHILYELVFGICFEVTTFFLLLLEK